MFSSRFVRGSWLTPRDRQDESKARLEGGRVVDGRPEGLRDHFGQDDLPSACMQAVFGYWCDALQEGGLPPVDIIDPTRLPLGCLPHIALLDVEASPLRFRTRLTGTHVVDALGIDHTGLYLDQIPGMTGQIERITWCARQQRPYLSEATVSFAPNNYKRYHVLTLPFGDPAQGVERIMFVFHFQESAANGSSK